ncbi:shikimate dehydrogenase [Candidatus Blochmanniella camponoti]|uniref:Shikimate dehydrogenase (NADP(+)) n=1 Tax=Candidatus Blochmanniella camponoti TaxID=108080 RepID=A0ABY4SV22_9ENTR|nr:shikimate dehydrogenase [Candidatus Blochmannia herculeanus]URJ24646.1 shikimate dehydrogenase [Candidatus Blochmannia herculeanus]URJ26746.1 shikimate dehydrogenase [Candidatus Blochmannia herculeanus]
MNSFAVFGNPIKHSKSAEIYALFAQEIGISTEYNLKLAVQDNFNCLLYNFFELGGLGANITSPFKENAYFLCNQLTERAEKARSVNTIKKLKNGTLLGDNTDGIGFISDLKRLNWLDNNNQITSHTPMITNILLIGAGGAAKGIIPILLTTITTCHINIVNRTFSRAQELTSYYQEIGYKNISCLPLYKLRYDTHKYSLIINATTSNIHSTIPKIPYFLITPDTKCYDLFYTKQDTLFITWCKKNGSNYCADGLGMLVGQAAHSFFLWHNAFPTIDPVINHLRSTCYM